MIRHNLALPMPARMQSPMPARMQSPMSSGIDDGAEPPSSCTPALKVALRDSGSGGVAAALLDSKIVNPNRSIGHLLALGGA